MTEATVYLSLGSNMGDRRANLVKAVRFLREKLRIDKMSSVYDTAPVGDFNQPRFLNLVCQARTSLAPAALLKLAKDIESKLGRTGKTGGPRPIDIDILLYDGQVVKTPELIIPHPRMTGRAFVLVPLAEIAPDVVHPTTCKTIDALLSELKEKQDVVRVAQEAKCIPFP